MPRPRTSRSPRRAGASRLRPAFRQSGDGSWCASTCRQSRTLTG